MRPRSQERGSRPAVSGSASRAAALRTAAPRSTPGTRAPAASRRGVAVDQAGAVQKVAGRHHAEADSDGAAGPPAPSFDNRPTARTMGRVRLGSAKEERAVKSLLLATALLGSVSGPVPASADLATGCPGDGTADAPASVPLMLAKGSGRPQGSGTSQGSGATRGSKGSGASHGEGGYPGSTGEGGYRQSGPSNSSSADQPTPNTPRTLRSSPPPAPPAAPPTNP